MEIAIAADTSDVDGDVAAQGARAPFYLIFDEDGHLLAAPANPVAVRSGGKAGPAAAQFLAGDFGRHFIEALEKRGIHTLQQTGRAADVIARWIARGGGR